MGKQIITASGKAVTQFRDYDNALPRVEAFYAANHKHQTLDFVLEKKREYLSLNRKTFTVWEALEFLNSLVDDSDPDVDFTQIEHALQTAESIRARRSAAMVHRHRPGPRSRQDPLPVRRAAVGGRRRHVPGRLPLVAEDCLQPFLQRES